MIEFDTVSFETNNDFEFGRSHIKRTSQYRIYNKEAGNGLVVYIPGFGGDLGDYTDVFCKKIAERYDVSTMSVDYFCISSRLNVGADVFFELQDHLELKKKISNSGGIPCDEINRNVEILNNICRLENKREILYASLRPKNNEYQNFGIMPALDVFNAVRDAVSRFNLDENNIILAGSSYGGYIANLVTKIAPGFIRAVFDNSSWAVPNFSYVVGRDLTFHSAEYEVGLSENILLWLYVRSPWTLVSGLPNSLEKSRLHIRSFGQSQLKMMADLGAAASTYYCFYHSSTDKIALTSEKNDMIKNMTDLGFNVMSKIIEESDVDGVFIKNLSHGMDMSMTRFFGICYDFISQNQKVFVPGKRDMVSYPFEDCSYNFDLRDYPVNAFILEK